VRERENKPARGRIGEGQSCAGCLQEVARSRVAACLRHAGPGLVRRSGLPAQGEGEGMRSPPCARAGAPRGMQGGCSTGTREGEEGEGQVAGAAEVDLLPHRGAAARGRAP
jgi:hypothetical protein